MGGCVRCGRGAGRGVVSMPRPGWGGGVKYGGRALGIPLAACGFGASGFGRCRCRFGLSAHYDRGRVGGCQGGILGNMSLGGIPAYAGMTVKGAGMTGWGTGVMGRGDGDGGTQRRRGAMKRRGCGTWVRRRGTLGYS